MQVNCRAFTPGLNPRRTKLEVPGSGRRTAAPQGRIDGAGLALPPYSEAVVHGIDLFSDPTNRASVTRTAANWAWTATEPSPEGCRRPMAVPFHPFGDLFLQLPALPRFQGRRKLGDATRPHPRFYTDPTDTTPIAVPALIGLRRPMIYFLVFKSPPEGKTHIFRPGEPFAQILIVPEEAAFDLVPMEDEEAAERELQSRRIYQSRGTLSAETEWKSATNTVFDGTYRHILGAATEKAKRRP